MRAIAPNVVDEGEKNPLKTPVLSGGLGGKAIVKRPAQRIMSGIRKQTFLQALQQEIAGSGIDLGNIHVQVFKRYPEDYPAPVLKNPHELVQEIEESIIDRVIARQNSTPCNSVNLSGGQRLVLFKAIKKISTAALAGEMYIIGITVDPAGNAAGRPASSPLSMT